MDSIEEITAQAMGLVTAETKSAELLNIEVVRELNEDLGFDSINDLKWYKTKVGIAVVSMNADDIDNIRIARIEWDEVVRVDLPRFRLYISVFECQNFLDIE